MSKKPVHPCEKCESIATQIYPEYKLCDQHYREVNLIDVNEVFMENVKHQEFIENIFRDIFYESWMDEEDYQELISKIKRVALDMETLSNQIDQGIAKGYSLEAQREIIVYSFKSIKK